VVKFAHLLYIDDSQHQEVRVFSALAIPIDQWQAAFDRVKAFRQDLQRSHGISIYKEFHAWKFVSGRGNLGNESIAGGWEAHRMRRCALFRRTLAMVATLPGAMLFNVCRVDAEGWAFERLLNRINKNMQVNNSHAILICDEGKDEAYTRLCRRMKVFNPIPSAYGEWAGGESRKNIPIERIIEDPVFKDSKRSYFVQLADFCAYAVLRHKYPIPSKMKYGLHTAIEELKPICVLEANRRDCYGIID
jgi:hypothetical protein